MEKAFHDLGRQHFRRIYDNLRKAMGHDVAPHLAVAGRERPFSLRAASSCLQRLNSLHGCQQRRRAIDILLAARAADREFRITPFLRDRQTADLAASPHAVASGTGLWSRPD